MLQHTDVSDAPRVGEPLTALERGFLLGLMSFRLDRGEESEEAMRVMKAMMLRVTLKLDLTNPGEVLAS